MRETHNRKELYESSHLVILISYTIFVIMFLVDTFIRDWEKWPLVLVFAGLIISWTMHIRNNPGDYQRIWFYAAMIMCTLFMYGTHDSSTFDLAVVASVVIILFTITSIKGLTYLCQITYYITMGYGLFNLYRMGETFSVNLINRTVLHVVLITMIAWIARSIIDRWSDVLDRSEYEIEELTESTERLNDFLANVSHELRTPVNAVIGLSGICIEKESNEEVKKDLVSIRSAGRKVAEQIGDILDYSEIDKGRLIRNDEDYLLSSMINDIIADFRDDIPDGVELIVNITPSIPAVMNSDVTKIKKIVKALISNGLKYTREGGVYVEIDSEKHDYGVNLRITVTDTGIGMTEEELGKIYERYYQSDSSRTRSSGGLGLGLGIVAGFVSLLGGFMTINSKVDEGTTVRVSIPERVIDEKHCMSIENPENLAVGVFLHFDKFSDPRVRDYYSRVAVSMATGLGIGMQTVDSVESLKKLLDTTELTHLFIGNAEYTENSKYIESLTSRMRVIVVAEKGFSLKKGSGASLMHKPFYGIPVAAILNSGIRGVELSHKKMYLESVRALVVDDEPMNLIVAKSLFGRYGMVVTTAASGPESIEKSREMEFDIIFMDHMMGGMDGVEAMKRIRADVSGHGQNIPIVALTANAMSSAKQMFISEGFDGFISKPIEIEEFERTMKKVLPGGMIKYIDKDDDIEERNAGRTDNNSYEDNASDKADTTTGAADAGRTDNLSGVDAVSFEDKLKAAHIDVDTGLGYAAGDVEFYKVILEQFAGEAADKIMKMNAHVSNSAYKDYEIIIHAVKSTSKMIGAMDLSEEAFKLEEAAGKQDADYIKEHHEAVMKRFRDLSDGILTALGKKTESRDSDDVMEFGPESDDVMEFGSGSDDVMEFGPENDDVMEFDPESDDVMEFDPESDDVMGFGSGSDDDVIEFGPEENSGTEES